MSMLSQPKGKQPLNNKQPRKSNLGSKGRPLLESKKRPSSPLRKPNIKK
jgi:hypothetical protein